MPVDPNEAVQLSDRQEAALLALADHDVPIMAGVLAGQMTANANGRVTSITNARYAASALAENGLATEINPESRTRTRYEITNAGRAEAARRRFAKATRSTVTELAAATVASILTGAGECPAARKSSGWTVTADRGAVLVNYRAAATGEAERKRGALTRWAAVLEEAGLTVARQGTPQAPWLKVSAPAKAPDKAPDISSLVLVAAEETCHWYPSTWNAVDDSGGRWYLRFDGHRGTISRRPLDPPVHEFLSADHWGKITLREFCGLAGITWAAHVMAPGDRAIWKGTIGAFRREVTIAAARSSYLRPADGELVYDIDDPVTDCTVLSIPAAQLEPVTAAPAAENGDGHGQRP